MSLINKYEDIVVSGISGRYPDSNNVDEFAAKLYSSTDLVSQDDRRWPPGIFGLPKRNAKINNIDRYDRKFFGISETDANIMDAQMRVGSEITYEAIWDAGIDPNSLAGSNTGIFVGVCYNETSLAQGSNYLNISEYLQLTFGRIGQLFNFKGPSLLLDTACASSLSAMHEAMTALRNRRCDRAIVLGINIAMNPMTQVQFWVLNMMSPDGRCKCLDKDADGYAKGEACVAVMLQKKSEAKRSYVTVVHSKTNVDGFKEMGITFPSTKLQERLMRETYIEAGIDPLEVKYIEAHCTGTKAGDPVEMGAIVGAMCTGRKEPLLIGAVKSNTGHTEGSSGLTSLSKVIISLENQCIPPNIHFNELNADIPGLVSGILKPITENTPFFERLVALNCFGFGGANVSTIVRAGNNWPSIENNDIFGSIPRLVLMCGRTEEAVNHMLTSITNTPKLQTRDYLSLINDISKSSPFKSTNNSLNGMKFRGFAVLDKTVDNNNNNSIQSKVIELKKVSKTESELWYVFSGMGCQWPTMGKDLMAIDVFANSIRSSAHVLKEYKIDLIDILSENNEKLFQCPLNVFISLAAIQIALVDLFTVLDITPNGIVGHSIGELICAYADNCISAEEAIRIAYFRGKCVRDEKNIKGSMAAIGLSLEEVETRKPDNVFIACHNSEDSVTVSGDESVINSFVERLNSDNVFARPVECCGIPFHSPLLSNIRKTLLNQLKKIIPNERMRSKKWISSTYEESNSRSNYITAEYFTDDLIHPVLFANTLNHIPRNAVVIEISSHHLLQAILKRGLGPNVTYIPTMRKNENNIDFILENIGKLYTIGANPSIEKLYPKVSYPVSRGTQSISSLIEWNHKKSYKIFKFPEYFNPLSLANNSARVDLQDEEHSFLSGHCIDGRVLFPATGSLVIVWKQFAQLNGINYEQFAVEFTNIRLIRATILSKNGSTKFDIRISKTNGEFTVSESGSLTVTGRICAAEKSGNKFEYLLNEEMMKSKEFFDKNDGLILETKDVYKELRLRGYEYVKDFQCISKAVLKGNYMKASIKWQENWVTFADTLLQTSILGIGGRGLYLPVGIEYLRFDPIALVDEVKRIGTEAPEFPSIFDYYLSIGVTKGLEFKGVKVNLAQRRIRSTVPFIESYQFKPNNDVEALNRDEEKRINEYITKCNEIAIKIAKTFNIESNHKSNANVFESFNVCKILAKDESNDKSSEDHLLLNLLKDMNCLEDNTIDYKQRLELKDKILNLNKDLINNCIKKEYFLRSQMDIIYENINKSLINILEVNQSSGIIGQDIIKLMNTTTVNMSINYKLLHPNLKQLSDEYNSDIEMREWNANKSTIPPDFNEQDVIIFEDLFTYGYPNESSIHLKVFFESVWKSLKEKGFLIIFIKSQLTFAEEVLTRIISNELSFSQSLSKRYNEIITESENIGFSLMWTKFDGISNKALVFRKITTTITSEKQTFIEVSEDKCELWIEKLQNSLKSIVKRPENENIWLLAKDSPTNGLIGFVNCLRKEPNGQRIRCVFDYDLSLKHSKEGNKPFDRDLLESIVKKDLVMNVLNSDRELGSFRHFSLDLFQRQPSEHCYLNVQTRGDISSFAWFESSHKYWPLGRKPNEMLCHIHYSALNFKDVMLATGKLMADALPEDQSNQDCILGLEYSGTDENNNRIMGIVANKGLATTVVIPNMDFVWPIPEHWSMEEAVTVPIVYTTAYYALIIRGKLKPKETVLIHSGSGGVGQAAIAICLGLECHLFITCGSETKRQFLLNEFPKLCDKNFCSSRDVSFEPFIMNATNGRGVDVVLNSLSEEKLQSSVKCLATNGRFLEIGKYDLSLNNELDLSKLLVNKTYHGIFLDTLIGHQTNSSPIVKTHKELIRKLLDNGIKDGTVRPLMRTVFESSQVEQAFRYMASGKHIGKVVLKIRDEKINSIDSVLKYPSIPRSVFRSNKSYIIIGGLGGFGLELANWMIEKGVIHLILTARSGVKDSYQKIRLKYFESLGTNVKISCIDVSDVSKCQELIDLGNSMGDGVGGIFNLALVLSDELFENQTIETFNKVLAPKALAVHNLDVVSRKSCPNLDYFVCFSSVACGRGNGGQTNYGFGNSVMERLCELRKAQGLHGLCIQWGAVGDVGYVAENLSNDTVIGGTLPQRMYSCLATLDRILSTDWSVVSSFVKYNSDLGKSNKNDNIVKRIGHILGIENFSSLDPNTKLVDLGMDSLMGVEIKQILERDYDKAFSVQEVRNLTIGSIASIGAQTHNCETIEKKIQNNINEFIFEIPFDLFIHLNDVSNGKPIMVLPPIEGSFRSLTELAKNINRPVIGINWINECINLKTIEETAEYYVTGLKEEFGSDYDLMGYSFGGCVAYEMAIRLQSKQINAKPKLILLDSSPILISSYAQRIVDDFDEQHTNDDMVPLLALTKLYFPSDYQHFKAIIENIPNEERVTKFSEIILSSLGISHNVNDIGFISTSFNNKVTMLINHTTCDKKLDNDVLLIRAEQSVISVKNFIQNDFGLSDIISGKCVTHVLKGDHKSFLIDNSEKASEIINEYLYMN